MLKWANQTQNYQEVDLCFRLRGVSGVIKFIQINFVTLKHAVNYELLGSVKIIYLWTGQNTSVHNKVNSTILVWSLCFTLSKELRGWGFIELTKHLALLWLGLGLHII